MATPNPYLTGPPPRGRVRFTCSKCGLEQILREGHEVVACAACMRPGFDTTGALEAAAARRRLDRIPAGPPARELELPRTGWMGKLVRVGEIAGKIIESIRPGPAVPIDQPGQPHAHGPHGSRPGEDR